MFSILSNLHRQQKMASFYMNFEDMTKFFYGKIIAINESECAIYMLSPDGNYDGIVVKSIDDVIKIEIDGQYEEKMKKLMLLSSKDRCEEYQLDEDNITKSLLKYAANAQTIVSIELLHSGNNDVVGNVLAIEDTVCILRNIDAYGNEDGKTYIRLQDITQLVCASQDEVRISRLLK